jgi:hypothetical protein
MDFADAQCRRRLAAAAAQATAERRRLLRLARQRQRQRQRQRTEPVPPAEERPRLVREFVQFIVRHLLHVDSAPTLSRFFTYRDCQDRMFVMKLIGMVKHALRVRKTKPRKENQKRINSVLNFYGHAESYQTLATGCITFQLTGGIGAVVSEVPKDREDTYGDEAPGEYEPPPLVRLHHGAAEDISNARLQRIIASMAAGEDPWIDVGATTGVILAVSMELIIRMRRFHEYPFKLCLLSKTQKLPFTAAWCKSNLLFITLATTHVGFESVSNHIR